MTNHTKIGTCPHCGAPVWARKRAQGDNESTDGPKPPKAEYSCDCRLAAIPVQVPPVTYPAGWEYWWSPHYPYKITCATTTDAYTTIGDDVTSWITCGTPCDTTAMIYATN
jgi:hypothetical protein